jgi:hypothetical protein
MIITPSKDGFYEEEGELFYYVNGNRTFGGLIKVDDNNPITIHCFDDSTKPAENGYYYIMSNGQVVRNRYFWTSKTNDTGFEPGAYYFNADGVMETPEVKEGIYVENGSLFYYEDDQRVGKGLIKLDSNTKVHDGDTVSDAEEGYYYVLDSGELVHGRSYWITKLNGIEGFQEGSYNFDDNGRMIPKQVKNGIVAENGKLYYYVDGARNFGGLMLIDGDYYYAKADGEIICSKNYYVSKTNGLLAAGVYQFGADGRMVNKP